MLMMLGVRSLIGPLHRRVRRFVSFARSLAFGSSHPKSSCLRFFQKVLGVWLSIHADRLEVRPDSSRLTKVIHSLRSCLETDQLRPEEAHRLCGKLVFLQSSLLGMVGMAAMHPLYMLYARPHGGAEQSLELNQGLRRAIQALIALLGKATPRCIPLRRGGQQTSIVYADAFF